MSHDHHTHESRPHRITRRRVLSGTAVATTALVAGCVQRDGGADVPTDPIDLAGEVCEVCGMVIDEHPGPNGQVFFADGNPPERDGPARFDSLPCLRNYLLEADRNGWEPVAVLVTDYSTLDYGIETIGGRTYISSHTEPDDFADATTLVYLIGSIVEGAMGVATVPFSDADDAETLVDEYGGEVRQWDDLPSPRAVW